MFRRNAPFGSLCGKKSVVYPLIGRYVVVHLLRNGRGSWSVRSRGRLLRVPCGRRVGRGRRESVAETVSDQPEAGLYARSVKDSMLTEP